MKCRQSFAAAFGAFFSLTAFSQLYQRVLFERMTPADERADEAIFVNSLHSSLGRRLCSWVGICGLTHLNRAGWDAKSGYTEQMRTATENTPFSATELEDFLQDARTLPEDWSEREMDARHIPSFVTDHAPLIHLYSGEEFWPGDMAEHLLHTTPHLNYTPLQGADDHPTLDNLNELTEKWSRFVYLQSDDNVEDRPKWLGGEQNIPNVPKDLRSSEAAWDKDPRTGGHFEEDRSGENEDWWDAGIGDAKERGGIRGPDPLSPSDRITVQLPKSEKLAKIPRNQQATFLGHQASQRGRKVVGGKSDAPAVLIVVPKDDGVVDAFWFFFYSYNLGNAVFNVRFGNHVGDWEHTTVRFHHGKPKAVFFSEHSFGEAYTWDAVEKSGTRPIGFSATGTHAMYATPGVHPYVLPGGILHDVTDRGPLWDPTLNMHSFTYDYTTDRLLTSDLTPHSPRGWFYFAGHWGDKFYPLSDPRQYRFLGQYHYVNGPLGPRFKNLGRKHICQGNDECVLKKWIGDKRIGKRPKPFPRVGEGEEMSEDDVARLYPDEA